MLVVRSQGCPRLLRSLACTCSRDEREREREMRGSQKLLDIATSIIVICNNFIFVYNYKQGGSLCLPPAIPDCCILHPWYISAYMVCVVNRITKVQTLQVYEEVTVSLD